MQVRNARSSESSITPNILSSKLLASSWRLRVYEDTLVYPKEKEAFVRARIELPHFVVAVGIRRNDGKMPLVRQYRHGARSTFWEFPAGYLEKGESAISCAKREFKEETGFDLVNPKKLGSAMLQPSRTNQRAHFVLGNLGQYNKPKRDIDEKLNVKLFSQESAMRAISKRASMAHLFALQLLKK